MRSDSGFRITPNPVGTHRVELWDTMPVGWLGNFTRATAGLSLDIVRGVARRGAHARWSADFEVHNGGLEEITRVDFLGLARRHSEDFETPALELSGFEMQRASDGLGSIVLTVRAPDRTGFLASLLSHLAGFVLFPTEIRIDTFKGEALDVIGLSSVGGESPTPEIETALRVSLLSRTL